MSSLKEKSSKTLFKGINIRLLSLMALLNCIVKASKDPDIGFEDTENTMGSILVELNRKVFCSIETIESALWSANMLQEADKFEHPLGFTFDQMLQEIHDANPRQQFDRVYNYFKRLKLEKKDDESNT